ncbi:hypothetical protein JCM24511_00821 [Saitozyma sp. JCM 24511]|nr:hypothetical protein JCM24511_00821 [Saitozyma sp. JCM 24511]
MIVLQSFFISGEVFASGSMTWLSRCLNELMIDASVNGLAIDAPKSFEDGSADHGGVETSSKEHSPLVDDNTSLVMARDVERRYVPPRRWREAIRHVRALVVETMRTSWNEGKMLRPPERKTRGSASERDAAEDMVA